MPSTRPPKPTPQGGCDSDDHAAHDFVRLSPADANESDASGGDTDDAADDSAAAPATNIAMLPLPTVPTTTLLPTAPPPTVPTTMLPPPMVPTTMRSTTAPPQQTVPLPMSTWTTVLTAPNGEWTATASSDSSREH
jgi:hypothetical protein